MNATPPRRPDQPSAPLGLIGVGLMGTAIGEMLLAAKFDVLGWDVSPDRRDALATIGGTVATGIDHVITNCHRVVLSLPSHDAVAAVLQSAIPALRPGQIVIDTSTGDPDAAVQQAALMALRGVQYMDATISGSSQQLRDRTAVFLVGGPEQSYRMCEDIFRQLSSKSYHVGAAGSGARMKLVTNLVLGLNRAALAEGLWFARSLGLDPHQTLFLLRESMSYSRIMDTKGEKMLQGDFTPQAKLSQHLKDVNLMLAAAADANVGLPLTDVHRQLLETAVQMGLGDLDNSAVLSAIERAGKGEALGRDAV